MGKRYLFWLVASVMLLEAKDLSQLLEEYRIASDLSSVTKIDSAGFVDIFTRDDIEKMQAKTLADVLETLTVLTLSRTNTGDYYFLKPSSDFIPTTAVRIFINDHDVTSSACGTVSEYWLDMPIELIDHIEVYKTASSIEFSNEPGTAIIRIYTKSPQREEGEKARLVGDNRRSAQIDLYSGHTKEDWSYFLYGHASHIQRKPYYHKGFELDSDYRDRYLYGSFSYKKYKAEISYRKKHKGNFLGLGRDGTPKDGYSHTTQYYLTLTGQSESGWKIEASYDRMRIHRLFDDESGIFAGAAGYVKSYDIHFIDDTLSFIANKRRSFGAHNLFYGGFFKYKKMHQFGAYDIRKSDFSFRTNLYSIYFEDRYNITDNLTLIGSFKGDIYSYDKNVPTRKKTIFRLGLIKKRPHLELKAFATKLYVPAESYKLYNADNIPYLSNPKLKFPDIKIAMTSAKYSFLRQFFEIRLSYHVIKHRCILDDEGRFDNDKQKITKRFVTLRYGYRFDPNNRLSLDIFKGSNSKHVEYSPDYGAVLKSFNKFENFELYNQLIYRCAYDYYGKRVGASWDYTAAVKYHFDDALSVGVRGENLFGTGYKQAYSTLGYPISVRDRKVWINIEYYF